MAIHQQRSPSRDESLTGRLDRLSEQLGPGGELTDLCQGLALANRWRVADLASLRRFLLDYVNGTLVPVELPAIAGGFERAQRYEARELIRLDQELGDLRLSPELAAASRQVGQAHLRRLRPLRDLRVVQRYRRAVEAGEAQGWHTLVYGLLLSVYSLPLRSGLLGYGSRAIQGFVAPAAARLSLSRAESQLTEAEAGAPLPGAVQALLAPREGVEVLRG